MNRFIPLLITLSFIFGCVNDPQPPHFMSQNDEYVALFGVLAPEVEAFYEDQTINYKRKEFLYPVSKGYVGLSGVKDSHLYLKVLDIVNYKEVVTVNGEEVIQSHYTYDIGYGQQTTQRVEDIYVNDFILTSGGTITSWWFAPIGVKVFFMSGSNERSTDFIQDPSWAPIALEGKNCVYVSKGRNTVGYCYSLSGEVLFEIKGNPSFGERWFNGIYTFINQKEVIELTTSYSSPFILMEVVKTNLETGDTSKVYTRFEVSPFGYGQGPRCETSIIVGDDNICLFMTNITEYSGAHSTKSFKLDIDTMEIVE